MTLLSDDFNDDIIKELIPTIKHRLAFKNARKELQFVNMLIRYMHTVLSFHMNRAGPNLMQETTQLEISKNTMDTVSDHFEDVLRKT